MAKQLSPPGAASTDSSGHSSPLVTDDGDKVAAEAWRRLRAQQPVQRRPGVPRFSRSVARAAAARRSDADGPLPAPHVGALGHAQPPARLRARVRTARTPSQITAAAATAMDSAASSTFESAGRIVREPS